VNVWSAVKSEPPIEMANGTVRVSELPGSVIAGAEHAIWVAEMKEAETISAEAPVPNRHDMEPSASR
jgi:hypothetical protein